MVEELEVDGSPGSDKHCSPTKAFKPFDVGLGFKLFGGVIITLQLGGIGLWVSKYIAGDHVMYCGSEHRASRYKHVMHDSLHSVAFVIDVMHDLFHIVNCRIISRFRVERVQRIQERFAGLN